MELSSHEGEIPLPIAIASKYGGDHGGHTIIPEPQHPSNGPPQAAAADGNHHSLVYTTNSGKKGVGVRYRECMKNHAASIGGNATDGCGEFMPSGEEGTMEALKCSACGCHRNFHRKEVEGESSVELMYHYHHHHHPKGRKVAVGEKGVLISGSDAFGYTPPHHNTLIPLPSPHQMIMPLGAMQTSESDEMEGVGAGFLRPPMLKKRFRTKFTPEQKEKMRSFAEKVGWRLQKQEESAVQQFCQEIGVKRRVLKVWMHNNKHNKSAIQLHQNHVAFAD